MRKKNIFIITLTVLLLFSAPGFALDHLYPAEVERVVDGDTIIVSLSLGLDIVLEHQWIKFYDIDAWELKKEEREKGLQAKEYLEERLSKGRIEIEIRPEWDKNGKEKYGRWLGIIYVDGVNINVEMMETGHAKKYE